MTAEENKVTNRKFEKLFKGNIQFEIPFFQRGYAWKKEHWDQLFKDIEEQVLSNIDFEPSFEDIEYFFGPIVVLERSNSDPVLKKFLVIDGQQRITTVYLLLASIKSILSEKSHESQKVNEYIASINKFLINESDDSDDYKKLKVFSCKGDRLPTYYSIFNNNTNPVTEYLNVDIELYNPQTNKIDAFRKYADKKLRQNYSTIPQLWQLTQILLKSLKIVWIPLDEKKDDPQAIFESLNDRGTPLTASELLCNYLFQPLIDSKENFEDLHNNYWLKTIKSIDTNGDFEDYLRIYLSIGEKKVIGKGRQIYVFFKMKHKTLNSHFSKEFLTELRDNYKSYNQLINPIVNRHINPKISELLIKINATRMEASNPFLLSVLKSNRLGSLSDEGAIEILNEVFVLLVRRKMCELPTQKYDTIFPNLLSRVINEPSKSKEIQKIIQEEGYWVSNQDFEYAAINNALYRKRDLPFSNMMLQEIDKKMQVYGQYPDYSTLDTIEHILPQEVDENWKAYLGEDANSIDLVKFTNTLGNLCLLSRPANSHAGRDPFESKKVDYTDISSLTRDVKGRNVKWNIQAIKERSTFLALKVLEIWSWNN